MLTCVSVFRCRVRFAFPIRRRNLTLLSCLNCRKSKCWSVIWDRCSKQNHPRRQRAPGQSDCARVRPNLCANPARREVHRLSRRGKYLLFRLRTARPAAPGPGWPPRHDRAHVPVAARAPLPKHAAVVLNLGREKFVFEDTRYFGRLTFDARAVAKLGPEPLGPEFTVEVSRALCAGQGRQSRSGCSTRRWLLAWATSTPAKRCSAPALLRPCPRGD